MRLPALFPLAPAALAALALSLSAAPRAGADEPSPSVLKMAQDLVEEGRSLGKDGRWADALERFRRAESLSHRTTPQLAFYVGYAEARVGKLVAANVDLRRAVELARTAGNDAVVKAAQAELPDIEARTPSLVVTVSGAARPTGLSIDGGALDVAAIGSPVPLDPGEHAVTVTFASGPATRSVSLVERQRATVAVDEPVGSASPAPVASPAPPPGPASPTTGGAEAPSGSGGSGGARRTIGVAGMGVGGALLVTGGVFYLLARSAMSPVTSACPSGGSCVVPAGSPLKADYDDAHNKQSVAIVLAGAGAAVAVAGVVLFATGGSSAGGSATVARLAPWAGPGAGGATLVGAF